MFVKKPPVFPLCVKIARKIQTKMSTILNDILLEAIEESQKNHCQKKSNTNWLSFQSGINGKQEKNAKR